MTVLLKTGLLKAGLLKAGAGVQPARRLTGAGDPIAPSPAERALARAQDEIVMLEAALAENAEQSRSAVAAARREGEAAARAAFADARDARLAALDTAAAAARARWDETLGGMETLAVLIARAALGRMVGACDDLAALVTRQIDHRIATLRRESIVALRVSTDDFTDDAALDALARDAGGIEVIADSALGPGDCRIDLQLGHIDLGVPAQWGALDALLGQLGGEAAR